MGRRKSDAASCGSLRPARRASRDEVARAANVSVFTVQRVFAKPEIVAEDTRRKVMEAAQRLGYQPNASGRALSTGRTGTVALVLLAHRLHGETLGATFDGFYHVLRARSLDVTVSIVPDEIAPHVWVQQLVLGRKCDAVAIHVESMTARETAAMEELGVPIVLLYFPFHDDRCRMLNSVTFDNVFGVEQAVRHLVALGHRRIGYFGGTPGWADSADREMGFRAAMRDARLDVDESWLAVCRFDAAAETAMEAFDRLFALPGPKPTAIVTASDWIACGVVLAAERWKRSVPGDLSVTGFDNALWSSFHRPPLTSVKYNGRDIGVVAAQTILDRLDHSASQVRNHVLPTQLVVRSSTAAPPPDSPAGGAT